MMNDKINHVSILAEVAECNHEYWWSSEIEADYQWWDPEWGPHEFI